MFVRIQVKNEIENLNSFYRKYRIFEAAAAAAVFMEKDDWLPPLSIVQQFVSNKTPRVAPQPPRKRNNGGTEKR